MWNVPRRISLAVALTAVVPVLAQAPQAPAPKPATFEVASIKVNKSGSRSSGGNTGNGRITATNISVRYLMRDAYQLQEFQLVNLPGWADSDRFDVAAKAEGKATPAEFRTMLQALLAERFNLVAHRETREMGAYNLALAKPDGKLGESLRKSACQAQTCGNTNTNNSVLRGEGITLDRFAEWLSQMLSRIVYNRTNLDGAYDIDLAWSNDPAVDPSHPSIFTALQEQLGLRLESARGPVEVLVVDRLEPPTPD